MISFSLRKELHMLHRYFVKPTTINRIRNSWIGAGIERYVAWLTEQGYSRQKVATWVPILVRFGEFTKKRGVIEWSELPQQQEPFITFWIKEHGKADLPEHALNLAGRTVRIPIEQLLSLLLPGYQNCAHGIGLADPFITSAPDFFPFLRNQRGLQQTTIGQYRHYLRHFETTLNRKNIANLSDISPAVLSNFVSESGPRWNKRSVQSLCSILKMFLRYLFSAGLIARNLSQCIESPRHYSLAQLPRSIASDEVQRLFGVVDRSTPTGIRNYAILLLLVTYGLRAREVAALAVHDIDWKRERLHIPMRKAGHSAVYPLSTAVGEAVLDYLQRGRPKTAVKTLFFRAIAPRVAITWNAVSLIAKRYIHKAGIDVPRPGSHTLRHTCVQRLVEARQSLKTIGDYVGHRTPDATKIYTKVDIETLREVALGVGEEAL
jgi:integrase/recombinase XerD